MVSESYFFFWTFCWFVVLDLYDETETEEDLKAEYLCPFCGEDFDVVGLFCHIDEEHPAEAKNGVLYSYRVLLMDVN
jgi:CRISPR/Cas system-associated protein Cas10 (large subunit of type III CRISPR-Cas system)